MTRAVHCTALVPPSVTGYNRKRLSMWSGSPHRPENGRPSHGRINAVRWGSCQPAEAAHARFVKAQGMGDLVQDRVGDRAPQGFSAAVIQQVRTPVDRDDVGSPKTTPVDDLVRR